MVQYVEAIKKPFSDLTTLAIGMILSIIPIVSLLVSGYVLKTAEDVIGKKNKLRAWKVDDIVEYVMKFIFGLVITIVYMIIPGIVIIVGAGTAILAGLSASATNPGAIISNIMTGFGAGAPILLVGVLLALVALFLLPMATMKWLKKGNLGAAFNVMDVVKNALTSDYIVTVIVAIVYAVVLSVIVGFIGAILALIPGIGLIVLILLQGLVSFVLGVSLYTMFAQTVK